LVFIFSCNGQQDVELVSRDTRLDFYHEWYELTNSTNDL
jgi:hypothetical protein